MIENEEKYEKAYDDWRQTGDALHLIAERHSVRLQRLSGYVGFMILNERAQRIEQARKAEEELIDAYYAENRKYYPTKKKITL